jgi:hypothetical protein
VGRITFHGTNIEWRREGKTWTLYAGTFLVRGASWDERNLIDACLAATPHAAAPVPEAHVTCGWCKGSGEGLAMEGRGPDTYEVTIQCEKCGGSGVRAAPTGPCEGCDVFGGCPEFCRCGNAPKA